MAKIVLIILTPKVTLITNLIFIRIIISYNHIISIHKIEDNLRKLQHGTIKRSVNNLVEARKRDGKLQKNVYTMFIDAV